LDAGALVGSPLIGLPDESARGMWYNVHMPLKSKTSSNTSTYDQMNAIIQGIESAAAEREQMDEHVKLVALIESGRHLLVGAKALAKYLEPRFTKDADYLAEHRLFQKVRKWLRQENIEHEDHGGIVQSKVLGIDVINADSHPVLKEILKRESGVPSPEALAATKYIAIVSGTRGQQKLHLDISDFIGLVNLDGFDVEKFLGYLVDRYEEQRPHAQELVDKIKRGEAPITI